MKFDSATIAALCSTLGAVFSAIGAIGSWRASSKAAKIASEAHQEQARIRANELKPRIRVELKLDNSPRTPKNTSVEYQRSFKILLINEGCPLDIHEITWDYDSSGLPYSYTFPSQKTYSKSFTFEKGSKDIGTYYLRAELKENPSNAPLNINWPRMNLSIRLTDPRNDQEITKDYSFDISHVGD